MSPDVQTWHWEYFKSRTDVLLICPIVVCRIDWSRSVLVTKMVSHGLNQWLSTWLKAGTTQGAQLHAMHLSDQKGWILAPPFPRPHLRVGSGGEGILLEISVYIIRSNSKQILFLCFCVHGYCIWACPCLLQPRTLPLCYYSCIFHHIIALHTS